MVVIGVDGTGDLLLRMPVVGRGCLCFYLFLNLF